MAFLRHLSSPLGPFGSPSIIPCASLPLHLEHELQAHKASVLADCELLPASLCVLSHTPSGNWICICFVKFIQSAVSALNSP